MAMQNEDHQGISIPVGSPAPKDAPTITPTSGGWPGTKSKGTWGEGNGGNSNGSSGKKK
jgi:hypothetical protein